MDNIQESVNELYKTTTNIRVEVLDIKEVLADFDNRISKVWSQIDTTEGEFEEKLENLPYMTREEIVENYYNKETVDEMFNGLDYMCKSDVEKLLGEHDYVTSDNIKTFVSFSTLEGYVNGVLSDYSKTSDIRNTYVTKDEFKKANNNVDLSSYVDYDYLRGNFYSKYEVDSLIPDTTRFVKKSELLTILPLNDYALEDWVEKTFVKKGEISLKGYVTEKMLKDSIPSTVGLVSEQYLKDCLSKYILHDVADKEMSDIVNNMTTYLHVELEKYVNKPELDSKLNSYVKTNDVVNIIHQLFEEPDFSDFLKKSDLEGYLTLDSLDRTKDDILNLVNIFYIPKALNDFKEKMEYMTENEVSSQYVSKSDFRKYISGEQSNDNTLDMAGLVQKSDLENYVKVKKFDDSLSSFKNNLVDSYIPSTLNVFKIQNDLTSKGYVDKTFVPKSEYANFKSEIISELSKISDSNNPNVDLNSYVKHDELKEYDKKLSNKFNSEIGDINTHLESINNSLKTYVNVSQLRNLVKSDDIEDYLNDYVTYSYLDEKIKQINSDKVETPTVDMSEYLTMDDYNNIKSYINSALSKYVDRQDVYTKDVINKRYYDISTVEDLYYDKKESDDRFLTKDTATNKYLSIKDAYGQFLAKEDYRGIKDAMTLNSAYKNSKTIFEELLMESKIYDGFYIIEDQIVVVKDGKSYETNLTGSNSYTKNEADDKFVSIEYFINNNGKGWTYDKGGNY